PAVQSYPGVFRGAPGATGHAALLVRSRRPGKGAGGETTDVSPAADRVGTSGCAGFTRWAPCAAEGGPARGREPGAGAGPTATQSARRGRPPPAQLRPVATDLCAGA